MYNIRYQPRNRYFKSGIQLFLPKLTFGGKSCLNPDPVSKFCYTFRHIFPFDSSSHLIAGLIFPIFPQLRTSLSLKVSTGFSQCPEKAKGPY